MKKIFYAALILCVISNLNHLYCQALGPLQHFIQSNPPTNLIELCDNGVTLENNIKQTLSSTFSMSPQELRHIRPEIVKLVRHLTSLSQQDNDSIGTLLAPVVEYLPLDSSYTPRPMSATSITTVITRGANAVRHMSETELFELFIITTLCLSLINNDFETVHIFLLKTFGEPVFQSFENNLHRLLPIAIYAFKKNPQYGTKLIEFLAEYCSEAIDERYLANNVVLHHAIKQNNLPAIEMLLTEGFSSGTRNIAGFTPLQQAFFSPDGKTREKMLDMLMPYVNFYKEYTTLPTATSSGERSEFEKMVNKQLDFIRNQEHAFDQLTDKAFPADLQNLIFEITYGETYTKAKTIQSDCKMSHTEQVNTLPTRVVIMGIATVTLIFTVLEHLQTMQ